MADPILSPQARTDLDEAWDYLAGRNPEAADRFLDEFWASATRHAQFPLTGRTRDDLRPGLRSFEVGRCVVLFAPVADSIRIVRVLHGSRDIPRIMRDSDDE